MVVRPDGTHVLPVQNKICQNHIFKIQFSFAEKLERADVFLILWDSCEFYLYIPEADLTFTQRYTILYTL